MPKVKQRGRVPEPINNSQKLFCAGSWYTLFYAAIASFINPQRRIGYVPYFMRNIMSGNWFLTIFSAFEITLAVFLFMMASALFEFVRGGAERANDR